MLLWKNKFKYSVFIAASSTVGAAVKEWHLSNSVLAAENCFFLDMFLTVFRSDPKYL